MRSLTRRRESGQSLVEFALTLPLMALLIMVIIQLSLVFIAYYSETRMARETARWLAVHSASTDDDVVGTHVQSTMLPGLVGATPTTTFGSSGVDATSTVGRMTVSYTACVKSGAVCTNGARAAGQTLHVQMTYDVSNLIFLPANFRMGSLVVGIPTALPPYKVSVMVE